MAYQTITEMFQDVVMKFGSRSQLIVKQDGKFQGFNYNELGNRVKKLAGGLVSLGIQQGDRVAILSENRPEWAISDFAILSLGAVTVPIYPTLPAKQIEYILSDAGVKCILVADKVQLEKIQDIRSNVKTLQSVILMNERDEVDKSQVLRFSAVLKKGEEFEKGNPGFLQQSLSRIKPDDVVTFIYTSGTTGNPKGVMLTHKNFMSNVQNAKKIIPVNENDLFLSFLPLSHVFERMAGHFLAITSGSSIAYAESINTVGDNMREVHPTVMTSVPRLYEKMYGMVLDAVNAGSPIKKKLFFWAIGVGKEFMTKKQMDPKHQPDWKYKLAFKLVFHKLAQRVGGRIRFFVSGGAPLGKEIAEFFGAAGLLILEGYGLTETSPVIGVNRLDKFKFGTIGPILPNVEVKIAPDGEILTRGDHVMKGYYNNPEATKEAIDTEGWFHTGDIGFIDKDGFITITDRKKNLIVTSGGKNVAPQPIENLISSSRYIDQCMVIGDRRNFISALIVPNFPALSDYAKANGIEFPDVYELGRHPKINELIQNEIERLQVELAQYEKIKKFVILGREFSIDSGELTPTLKIKRKFVEQKFLDAIEGLYK